jgi:hypothetical protein
VATARPPGSITRARLGSSPRLSNLATHQRERRREDSTVYAEANAPRRLTVCDFEWCPAAAFSMWWHSTATRRFSFA